MKNVLILFLMAIVFSSCSAFRSALKPATSSQTKPAADNSRFIEDIAIQPDVNPVPAKNPGRSTPEFVTKQVSGYGAPLEMYSINQFKYAIQLNVPVETLTNASLYNLIDEWWNTPYRLGGTTKKGIDCSAFVQTLMLGVFAVQLPRTAREQRTASTKIETEEMREGDLVFFNTRGRVSHVGVYLHNNKFVHASTSGGVMISDLNEDYWRRKFIGAGRILQPILPRP
ncbi:MAG: C40 family peptidase [Chitinophagaceae bacterium]|nr:C40 family peptidase [Chitinophagaceae bacterium]